MDFTHIDTEIEKLGGEKFPSPLKKVQLDWNFISESERILVEVRTDRIESTLKKGINLPSFELAGPREKIFFNPEETRCAICTCGGLCPGLNDVIRAIVYELYYRYGVKDISGIRHGLQGFIPDLVDRVKG